MTVEHVEVLVEESSMESALHLILPRILGDRSFSVHAHQGKGDLLDKLPGKLAAYAKWLPSSARVVVIVDRDGDDCAELKTHLEKLADDAGLLTRTTAKGEQYRVLNRLAIEELEAWYFGDWEAVRAAYPRVPGTVPNKAPYRAPDAIKGGTWEAFERVLQGSGYFAGGLRKVEAARAVAEHMDPARNRSPSFRALRTALAEMA